MRSFKVPVLALFLLLTTTGALFAQPHFEVTPLGFSHAYSINDSGGFVAGFNEQLQEGVLWDHGTVILLGTLGGTYSVAAEVNDARQVAGWSGLPQNFSAGAFLWQNGSMSLLPGLSPESVETRAFGLNSGGTVVGTSDEWTENNDTSRAVVWIGGTPTNLGSTLGAYASTASDVNAGGIVAGYYYPWNDAGSFTNAVVWDGTDVTELGSLGGIFTWAIDINDAGQVIGLSTIASGEFHFFLWENGTMQDLGVPPVAGIQAYLQELAENPSRIPGKFGAVGMNDVGQIVAGGFFGSPYLWDNGTWYDLSDLIDDPDWELLSATEISNNTDIVGFGTYQGQPSAFLLTPTFSLTRPRSGDVWVAGETDTIRWVGHEFFGIDSVTISYSTNYQNGGGSFSQIVAGYPADSTKFAWQIPDDILSTQCVISIEDAQNFLIYDESPVFSVKPYILTRDSSGLYEPFRMYQDSWQFANRGSNMWPRDWWMQFDYANGTDPNTGQRYPPRFITWPLNADSSDFPDWPLFVRVFGTAQCYLSFNPDIYRPSAVDFWGATKGKYGGSCAGFAGTSFLAFDMKDEFINRFQIPPFGDLFQVSLSDDIRRAVNEGWVYELGALHRSNHADLITTPSATVDFLKEMLFFQNGDNRMLALWRSGNSGAHAVSPVSVRPGSGPNPVDTVYCYDSNHPGLNLQRLEVDRTTNVWAYYGFTTPWLGTKLLLEPPSSSYLQSPSLSRGNEGLIAASGSDLLEVYNSRSATIHISNSLGESIGFNVGDTTLVDDLPGGVHNIPVTGTLYPPIGYYLPEDTYSIVLEDFQDTESTFALFTDSLIVRYGRDDAASGQADRLSLDTGIGAANPDNAVKNVNFEAIVIDDTTSEKVFDLLGLAMVQNDSMHASTVNHDEMRLVNAGSGKSYSLFLRHATMTGEPRFEAFSVPLASNATHQIAPDWSDLSVVPIYVDLGNNGTFDDTLYIDNTVDVEDQGTYGIPSEYRLSQNYPNPFNPATRIRYALPEQAHVTLRVYNVLGQEVATLADGVEEAGFRTVEWNAAEVASGVYFYRIEARSTSGQRLFTDSKKMLLVR